jgi:transposase
MESVNQRLLASCLALPEHLVIAALQPAATSLIVSVSCRHLTAACPVCQQPSQRIHGSYRRTVADVPCGGRQVLLHLQVRKFVCTRPTCPQQIFTERFPDWVDSYARMTTRLHTLVQALGLVAGGEQGTRLAQRCGIQTSPATVLRHLMHLAAVPLPPVRVLGVDDWSWKKGHRYGTILVDLERHKIIGLLSDRTSATFAAWLWLHPEIEIISRDRGTDYAAAAREAAPQARQIADRFHLVRNVADILLLLLARCRAEIRTPPREDGAEPEPLPPDPPRTLPHPETWRQHPPGQMERAYQARQAEREDRFRQITALREQGLPFAAIAQRMGMAERSVRKWSKQGAAPTHRRRRRRHSIFDPYAAYVLERWQAGIQDGRQLFEEIRLQGFPGTIRVVQSFLQTLRTHRRPLTDLAPPSPAEQFSARAAVWLFIRAPEDLTDEEQRELAYIRQASGTAETAYGLIQDFLTMLRKREGARLDGWLQAAQASHIPELQRLALGILRDKEAVQAGLTEEYSNGQTEAQVHKLKFVKRSMFGRAKLPLLTQRLLHAV